MGESRSINENEQRSGRAPHGLHQESHRQKRRVTGGRACSISVIMSSYFGAVSMGEGIIEKLENTRAPFVVDAATYIGVAPELTTVLYAPGDKLGLASAMASLVPVGICVALLTVFLCRRTAEDLWVGVGQIGCEVLNGVLKLIIRQPRPSSPVTNMPVDSFGMPSAHAQYMGYFAMIIIMQTLKAREISLSHQSLRVVSVLAVSVFTAWSRFYLYYHSGSQVCVGFLVGSLFAISWMLVLQLLRAWGVVRWGLNLWPCRFFLVKDLDYSVVDEFKDYRAQVELSSKEKSD